MSRRVLLVSLVAARYTITTAVEDAADATTAITRPGYGYVGECVRDLARNASYEAPRLASKPTPVARASSSNPACVALAQRIREGGRCRAGRFCNARGRCYGNSACRLCETR